MCSCSSLNDRIIFLIKIGYFVGKHQQRYWQATISNHFIRPIKFPSNFITWKRLVSYYVTSRLIRENGRSLWKYNLTSRYFDYYFFKFDKIYMICSFVQNNYSLNLCKFWLDCDKLNKIISLTWCNRSQKRAICHKREMLECTIMAQQTFILYVLSTMWSH